MKTVRAQRGVTLMELMIGMTIGLFIVAGIITVYIATINSSRDTLSQSRLNQEMSAILNIMANDIRRAGYWSLASTESAINNPFTQYDEVDENDTTALLVMDSSDNTFISPQASGNCIVYSYDTDEDNSLDDDDRLGFRWGGTAGDPLLMRTAGTVADSCAAGDGTWESVNDTTSVSIDSLSFSLANSKCVNPTYEDSDANYDCYAVAPAADEATAEIREIVITLQASLVSDSLVDASMNQTVRVRNDLIRKF